MVNRDPCRGSRTPWHARPGKAWRSGSTLVSARAVSEALSRLVSERHASRHLRSDNGPGFVSRALLKWIVGHGIQTAGISTPHCGTRPSTQFVQGIGAATPPSPSRAETAFVLWTGLRFDARPQSAHLDERPRWPPSAKKPSFKYLVSNTHSSKAPRAKSPTWSMAYKPTGSTGPRIWVCPSIPKP